MPDHDPAHSVTLSGLDLPGAERLQRERAVRLVGQRPDPSGAPTIGPDTAHEQDDPAESGRSEFLQRPRRG
ncbi:MAG: hypothetical protein WAN74_07955 [Thermoplasmata archaeon]